jgi:hypothetical protein
MIPGGFPFDGPWIAEQTLASAGLWFSSSLPPTANNSIVSHSTFSHLR